jgi:hypothetical protein
MFYGCKCMILILLHTIKFKQMSTTALLLGCACVCYCLGFFFKSSMGQVIDLNYEMVTLHPAKFLFWLSPSLISGQTFTNSP